jgi:hypothetical protein
LPELEAETSEQRQTKKKGDAVIKPASPSISHESSHFVRQRFGVPNRLGAKASIFDTRRE